MVVRGFKPFRERQEIDFSRLEFFVIRGPTGSGKSSILDAIAFALFGRDGVSVNIDELINKNSRELYVDFTFEVGGKLYRIERSKEKGKASELRFYENNIRRAVRSEAVKREIKRLLGVDADQFKKIFFLPQGHYDAFFNAKPAERRELIVSLLDLEIYNQLAEKLKERLSDLENRLANIEGQLLSLAEASPGRIESLKREQIEIENTLKGIRERLALLEGEIKKLSSLGEKIERRKELLKELNSLGGEEYRRLKGEVEKLKPLRVLVPLLERYLLLKGQLSELLQREGELKGEIDLLGDRLKELVQKREGLRGQLDSLKGEEEKIKRYRQFLGYLDAQEPRYKHLREEKELIDNLRREIENSKKLLEGLLKELKTAEGLLEETLRRLEENPYTPEREKELELLLQRCKERDRIASEWEKVFRELRKEEREKEELLTELKGAEEQLEGIERQLEEYRKKEREYLVYLLVKDLKEGDPCPVCGCPIKDKRAHLPEDFDPRKLEELQQRQENLQKQLEEFNRKLTAKEVRIEELQRRLKELQERLGEFEELPPTGEVFEELKRLKGAKGERELLEGEKEKLEKRIQELRNKIASLEGKIKADEENLSRKLREFEEEKERLKQELLEIFQSVGLTPPKNKKWIPFLREFLKGEIETFEVRKKELENQLREVEAAIASLEGSLKTKKEQLEEIRRKGKTLKGEIENLEREMEMKGWDRGEDPEELLRRLEELPEKEKQLEQLEHSLKTLRLELEQLEKELSGVNEREVFTRLEELQREYNSLKGREEELLSKRGKIEATMKRLEEDLKKLQQLQGELERLRKEKALLEAVKNDFRSDRLIKFVVDRAIADLVEVAGEYLYKLSERYRFALEGGEILVEDQFLGARRPVKTLSGGETFLASLSFALALGEYIGKSASVESIFIDEGFGTLDKERLDRIGELFEKLRHSVDKVVGVITHLDELALRFDQRIEVVPSPDGSKIRVIA